MFTFLCQTWTRVTCTSVSATVPATFGSPIWSFVVILMPRHGVVARQVYCSVWFQWRAMNLPFNWKHQRFIQAYWQYRLHKICLNARRFVTLSEGGLLVGLERQGCCLQSVSLCGFCAFPFSVLVLHWNWWSDNKSLFLLSDQFLFTLSHGTSKRELWLPFLLI